MIIINEKQDMANIAYRVGKLEEKYGSIEEKIDNIRTNHLPHINQAISNLQTSQKIVGIMVGMTIVLQFVLKFLI